MKTETTVIERKEVTNGGPFASYLSGSESFETPEEWSGGEVWKTPSNGEQSLEWRAELPTPGYDWSEKTLLTITHTDFLPDKPFDTGFVIYAYPFDKNGDSTDSLIQPSLGVNAYNTLQEALTNAEQLMELMSEKESGDTIVICEKKYRIP